MCVGTKLEQKSWEGIKDIDGGNELRGRWNTRDKKQERAPGERERWRGEGKKGS